MNEISFTHSAMLFNRRVLELGTVESNTVYDPAELKRRLFFNQVFRSNTDEIFQKNNHEDIIPMYLDSFRASLQNINNLCRSLPLVDNSVELDTEDSFERRLITETRVKDQMISRQVRFQDLGSVNFLDGQLYYLTPFGTRVVLTTIDPRKAIYSSPLSYDFPGKVKFWKTEQCIVSYLDEVYGKTVVIRVTVARGDKRITKVEYDGDTVAMKLIMSAFPNALIVHNPYIYLGDISQLLGKMVPDGKEPIFHEDERLENESVSFTIDHLHEEDFLVEYPLYSFDVYLRFLHLVTINPIVQSISLCLYRIGDNPIIFYILRDAVRRGIKVLVNIETEASGETVNRFWVTEMRRTGIDVITYGSGHLKVHAKLTLVTFKDGRRIAQVGTGNYHWQTTGSYTDLSLMTSDPDICRSTADLFEVLSQEQKIKSPYFGDHFLVTRFNARDQLKRLIVEQAKLGTEGYIAIKCNSLDDREFSNCLEHAAEQGCQIELVIRGVCTWNPGRFLGKNVRVRSIVWDKLEHSRVYRFGWLNSSIYLGSLDPVSHKLDDRIETMIRVSNPLTSKSVADYLERYVTMSENAWFMFNDNGTVGYRKDGHDGTKL